MTLKHHTWIFGLLALLSFSSCKKEPVALAEEDLNEWYSGGKQTVFVSGSGAFGQRFPFLDEVKGKLHDVGDEHFSAIFNSDPNQLNYGLGPVFNNVSCASCHIADGRGKAPMPGEALSSMLLRISIPGAGANNGPQAAPGFGGQLQQRGILGAQPELNIQVSYVDQNYQFADGESYALRQPAFALSNSYTAMPAGYLISARMASPIFGLGLLEAIPEADILANADPNDANGDGVSGRPNYGWDVLKQQKVLGRFGWKAAQPNVLQQSAAAYNEDMGITNMIFPNESCNGQPQYALSMGKKELKDSILYSVGYYVKSLAVPGRRNANDPVVRQGKQIFNQIGCNACHKSMMTTETNMAFPELSNVTIFPYTDLLLHDMGPGLADNRPDYEANGQEWRTSPLWGIGLTTVVNGHNNFLHDGRARNFTEAIMWHGGEALGAKNRYASLSKAERDAVLKFLNSL